MQRSGNVKASVEGGFLTAITVLFALISFYMPAAGLLLVFIMPLPIAILGVRHGLRWSITATVATGLLAVILVNPIYAVIITVSFGLSGVVMGHCFHKGLNMTKSLLWGAAATLLSIAAGTLVAFLVIGVNPIVLQTEAVHKAMEYFAVRSGEGIRERIDNITKLYLLVFPAGLGVSALVISYVNLILTRLVLIRLGHRVAAFLPFRSWTIPGFMVFVYGLAMLSSYYGQIKSVPQVYQVGLNLQLIANALMVIQGLAFLAFMAEKYKLSRFVYTAVVLLFFSHEYFTQLLVLIGLFDLAFDIRKLRGVARRE